MSIVAEPNSKPDKHEAHQDIQTIVLTFWRCFFFAGDLDHAGHTF